jgi:hypothetical protein
MADQIVGLVITAVELGLKVKEAYDKVGDRSLETSHTSQIDFVMTISLRLRRMTRRAEPWLNASYAC